MKLNYDIPINFTISAESENQAVWLLQEFLRIAAALHDIEGDIVGYELFEFIPESAYNEEATTEPTNIGCGNNHCCKG